MNKRDLEQISTLFNKSFAQIWEHNLEPVLSGMDKRIDALPTTEKVNEIVDKKLADYPTKEYLDEKLGKQTGELRAAMNKRFDTLTGVLNRKRILSDSEVKLINNHNG